MAKKAKKSGLIDGTLQKAQDLLEGYIKPGAQSAARSAEATIEEALRMIGEARLRIMSFQRKPAARKRKTSTRKAVARKTVARKTAGSATRKRAGAKRKSAVAHKVAAAKRKVGAVKRGRRKTRR